MNLDSQAHDENAGGELPEMRDLLDADPTPTILVKIDVNSAQPFQIVFQNHAFIEAGLGDKALEDSKAGREFRAWCQAVLHWRKEYEFARTTWTGFRIGSRWKCIRGVKASLATNIVEYSPAAPVDSGTNVPDDRRKLEGLYRMMEMSDIGTFEYGPEGTLIRANESWYRLSLHPPGNAHTDFSFMDLVYPPDGPLVLSQWNKLVQGLPITFEMRWKGPNYRAPTATDPGNDDAQWILSACVPIMDKNNKLESIAGNTVDISAQKRIQEEALRRAEALERASASERRYATFAALAPIAIYILDSQGNMTYCNNRFFELTGHPITQDYQQIDWRAVTFPEDWLIFDDQWNRLLLKKKRTQDHFRLRRSWDLGDGVSRQAWAENQAIPELDEHGNIISVFGTMSEISRFKWAEDILRTRIEEALAAKKEHETFIDITSHEMRNPLSAVIQCADSTLDSIRTLQSLTPANNGGQMHAKIENEIKLIKDSMNTIISCSLHQKRIIDDVLTLSKMDSNLLTIAPVLVKPTSVILEAVSIFELQCKKDGINLRFVEDPSLQETNAQSVMMDPSRVTQVLINFITNAIKFTRDRPVREIEVTLGASSIRPSHNNKNIIPYIDTVNSAKPPLDGVEWGRGQKVYIWLKCRDSGCGLTKEEQGRLFTKFTQATPRTHIKYGGSGLGLFISKKLTELQGGAIGLLSEPDKGSTFAFFVAARVAPPNPPLPSSHIVAGTSTIVAPEKMKTQIETRYSVLIVEDNLVNQRVLTKQLRKIGYTVYVANHGVEALEFLRNSEYWRSAIKNEAAAKLSLILMDIEMPVMDGLTCARRIREYQRTGEIVGHIPIMAVSANARGEQVAEAHAAGMDDAISKPFRLIELLPKIEALAGAKGTTLMQNLST